MGPVAPELTKQKHWNTSGVLYCRQQYVYYCLSTLVLAHLGLATVCRKVAKQSVYCNDISFSLVGTIKTSNGNFLHS